MSASRNRGADALLDLVGDGVRLLEAEIARQLQMQLDEHVGAGAPGRRSCTPCASGCSRASVRM